MIIGLISLVGFMAFIVFLLVSGNATRKAEIKRLEERLEAFEDAIDAILRKDKAIGLHWKTVVIPRNNPKPVTSTFMGKTYTTLGEEMPLGKAIKLLIDHFNLKYHDDISLKK